MDVAVMTMVSSSKSGVCRPNGLACCGAKPRESMGEARRVEALFFAAI